jgi:hypothetical protein
VFLPKVGKHVQKAIYRKLKVGLDILCEHGHDPFEPQKPKVKDGFRHNNDKKIHPIWCP